MIARDTEYPKTHELLGLSRLLPAEIDVGVAAEELTSLGKWAVEPRYPGDVPEATRQDAEAAIEQARRVYETASRDLEQHGYDQTGEEV